MSVSRESPRPGSTTGAHGIDVSSRGTDKLDRDCLHFALDCDAPDATAIDLGCGLGAQSLRLAALGWRVWMYDQLDLAATVSSWNAIHGNRLTYVRRDLRRLAPADLPAAPRIVYSQRCLHYLPYADACDLLTMLAGTMPAGGRAFLSVSGLHGELGAGYSHATRPVRARFCRLAPEIADRYECHEPVCLYAEEDLAALVQRAGLQVDSLTRTTFGNLKGTFVR